MSIEDAIGFTPITLPSIKEKMAQGKALTIPEINYLIEGCERMNEKYYLIKEAKSLIEAQEEIIQELRRRHPEEFANTQGETK